MQIKLDMLMYLTKSWVIIVEIVEINTVIFTAPIQYLSSNTLSFKCHRD